PYTAPVTAPTTITTSTTLAFLNPANNAAALAAVQKLNLSATGKYLILGIGQRSTIIGKSIAEAPVLFADSQAISPTNAYARFAVLYLVSDPGNPSATPPVPVRTISQVQLAG